MRLLYLTYFLLLSINPSSAIIGRFDVPMELYEKHAEPYSSVCQVGGRDKLDGNFTYFTAIFIGRPDLFITVAGSLAMIEKSIVRCQETFYPIDEDSIFIHPSFKIENNRINGTDLALFRTTKEISRNIEPVSIYQGHLSSLQDTQITFVGYGKGGDNVNGASQIPEIEEIQRQALEIAATQNIQPHHNAKLVKVIKETVSKGTDIFQSFLELYGSLQPRRACEAVISASLNPMLPSFPLHLEEELREMLSFGADFPSLFSSTLSPHYLPGATLTFGYPIEESFSGLQSFSGKFSIDSSTPNLAGQPYVGDQGGGCFNDNKELVAIHTEMDVSTHNQKGFILNHNEFLARYLPWIEELKKITSPAHKKRRKKNT